MNCTGNCNQGRNCTCAPRRCQSKWIIVLLVGILIAIGVMIEIMLTGRADRSMAFVGGAVVLFAVIKVVAWIAGALVSSVSWMTRNE